MDYIHKDECWSNNFIICPYCNHEMIPDEGFYYSEDYTDDQCPQCNEKFKIEVYTETSWTSKKIEKSA